MTDFLLPMLCGVAITLACLVTLVVVLVAHGVRR